jgi:hypothetical protein
MAWPALRGDSQQPAIHADTASGTVRAHDTLDRRRVHLDGRGEQSESDCRHEHSSRERDRPTASEPDPRQMSPIMKPPPHAREPARPGYGQG